MDTDARLEELLAEEVRPDELREVLQRLGQEEFGGPEYSRVRDIVEATGKDPIDVARILAEIRKEDWEEKFGRIIEDHGDRIERLEDKAEQPAKVIVRTVRESVEINDPYLQEARDRIKQEHEQRPIAIAIAVVVLVVYLIVIAVKASNNQPPGPPIGTGVRMPDDPPMRIRTPDGSYRDATPGERASIEAAIRRSKGN